ncbi:MAG: RNA polymerase sigma factor [Bacteroidota bacterium]
MTSAKNIQIQELLVERCKQGDRKAQYELYKRYSKAMLNVAMRITNNYMEAEDVLQEAFVRAFRNLTSFKGDATFGAWLKRIVINTAINHLKKKRAEFVPIDDERLEVPEETTEAPAPAWNIETVRKAITQLPEGYRVVLSLYLIDGYDHKEIGLILGISEATSKSQYSRAKRKLRQILGERTSRAIVSPRRSLKRVSCQRCFSVRSFARHFLRSTRDIFAPHNF